MTPAEPGDGRDAATLSRRSLLLIAGGGFVAAAAVAVLFVLPVEMRRDPTGFGRISGLNRLAGPEEVAAPARSAGSAPARFYTAPLRSDVIVIPLDTGDNGLGKNELEYKVRMKAGATVVYSWTVDGVANPAEFYFDHHGESPPKPQVTVATYRQATGIASSGALVAPFDGVHGWYLQNQSAKPVVVRIRLSGFYDLVPAGEPGNLAGILPAG